ncbi:ATP-binding cassette domain-containing protein [Frankia sp. AgPm24]|uniref:ABC transporter ATP-binding protein n=1 Tax=Frankia sp. AgPm24 TaxID=631128 RepID=UPI00200F157A|nr:ATP-binding cassette domain-containing protein [Frankia sp. AgPm24]MCK9921006.1 ATP-binding cassette domain-containing protein [Frankia sp. AgPm24]
MRSDPTAPDLAFTSLTKRFGAVVALDDVTFTAPPGTVTALVGPNGSGKTTLMRVALGLATPTSGQALVAGRRYRHLDEPLTRIGALLDACALNPGLTGRTHLRWLAAAGGVPAARADALLEQVGLGAAARRRVGGWSLGMKQRLGLAVALLGDPPVLMLDEPMNGLDPEGMTWFRGLVRGLRAEGRTLLLSSHLMRELEGIADRVVVINHGRIVADASIDSLLADSLDTSDRPGLEDAYLRLVTSPAQVRP